MSRRAALICMMLVLAAALVLRLHLIGSRSFWLDEAYSWTMATRCSLCEILQRTAYDFHSPLYFMALKFRIAMFGDSEAAQRMLSVAFDLLAVVSLYLFCRDAFAGKNGSVGKDAARSVGCLAAALYAVNGIHIHWSVETRMYSMASFLAVLSCWLLVRGIESTQRRWWIAYVSSATALLYTHNYGVFTIFAQACFLVGLLTKTVQICSADFLAWICTDRRERSHLGC